MLTYPLSGGRSVSALPDLSEELMVESPIHALCRPDCKGLCDRCGANLNREKCSCK